ncbi:MAG: hypothetical protein ACK4HR_03435 [Hyphomonas sp.]|jgi:hypothetical protein
MRLTFLLAALLLAACSPETPPQEERAAPVPAPLEDLVEEEIGEAAPIEVVPSSAQPAAAPAEQPLYTFDNPPPDAQRIDVPETGTETVSPQQEN